MRGGSREKVKFKKGDQALLAAIWEKYGGPAEIARLCKLHQQSLVNWRLRGKVPLKMVKLISQTLGIPMWGLNYEEIKFVTTSELPSWKEVVTSYGLGKEIEKRILFLKPPKA